LDIERVDENNGSYRGISARGDNSAAAWCWSLRYASAGGRTSKAAPAALRATKPGIASPFDADHTSASWFTQVAGEPSKPKPLWRRIVTSLVIANNDLMMLENDQIA
jgi:hypothetical protein